MRIRMLLPLTLALLLAASPALAEGWLDGVGTGSDLPWLFAEADARRVALTRIISAAQPAGENDIPADLVTVPRRHYAGDGGLSYEQADDLIQLREPALAALTDLMRAAEEAGIPLYLRSGYRSYADETARCARLTAFGLSADRPGESDAQTGLSVVLVGQAQRGQTLTDAFSASSEGRFLAENAHLYGFVLRYPAGHEAHTGHEAAPRVLRYVGDAATEMRQENLCLEELALQTFPEPVWRESP